MASVVVVLVLAAVSLAKKGRAAPTGRQCVQLEVPVSVNTTATHWLQQKVDSNIDAVDYVYDMTTWTSPNTTSRILGEITVKETFKITGQLCVPAKGSRSDTLQIATHGVGFDKRYWDAEVKPEQYSYVNAALAEGYSIFTYDRLGTGGSSKPDAYDVVSAGVQVEILHQLTALARSGKLVSSSKKSGGVSNLGNYRPKKIIQVGHSLGSAIVIGLLTADGASSDGAIITGFLYNSQIGGASLAPWGFEFAKENDPKKFGDRGSGYIVQATKSNTQLIFLKKGAFEPALLDYAWKIRQPNTVGEFVSLTTVLGHPAPDFKGPIQDYGFCRGDCKNTYNVTEIKSLYPASSALSVYLQPGTGHGLTLSTNATAGYKVSFDFLHASGL
ncbi:hypothetical protein B0T14DRAFT_471472 [Immersiella caudata]|uniref:AB hydrolase-1 domain-containing protein n=1 Tax=Immersiella caudata TaxID=314043 RepID=A0AA40C5N0_9PEZI|nr:hypothetical protein B0T14DRAFT_471472 [Immersiella caudata]